MGPNFSEEGITRDLEAMKETGVAGATIFHITSAVQESQAPTLNNPWPENIYRSSRWWDAMRHAAAEAERLGLKLGLHNTAGYSTTGGPWIDEESGMQCFVSSKTVVEGGRHVSVKLGQATPPPYRGRGGTGRTASFYRDIAAIAVPADGAADPSSAIDISRYMKPDGTLDWTAPDGTWTIVRMGYAPTMATPHPLPDDLIRKSMEVDKMGRQHSILHWNEVLRPMEKNLGKYLGNTFDHILIDSYEAGRQSWTEGFEKEFRKIKGYDPLPWLTGLVGTEDERRRFRTDLDDVIAELYRRNGFEVGRDFIHKYGMLLYSEPYGGPFNTLDNTLLADVPMGEFWTSSDGRIQPAVVASARAGGKRIIAAEAFTSRPEVSAWTEDPAFLKRSADGTFCCGVNRLVLHHWVHQPFDDRYRPGMSMGWWGTHFGRNQIWFEPGKAFFKYITRIQYMLQQGDPVSPYLCLDTPQGDGDAISSSYLLRENIVVRNGRIILPSGRSYDFIVCPDTEEADPAVLRKLKKLQDRGATIVGKAPTRARGLSGYPESDMQVREIAGTIEFIPTIEEARQRLNLAPEVSHAASPEEVICTARRTADGRHIIFMSNRSGAAIRDTFSIRSGMHHAELWNPETGSITAASARICNGRRLEVSLDLQPNQSIFIVTAPEGGAAAAPAGHTVQTAAIRPELPWSVEFRPAVDSAFSCEFHQLADFSKHTDERIMYFAGEVTYRTSFFLPDSLAGSGEVILDLGELHDIAEVKLNGKDLGVWWYPPYSKSVKDAVHSGENSLEITVTVNWANRLIGDERYPADFEWGDDRGRLGRAIKAYPEWFIKGEPRPSERRTFVIWSYYREDSPLQPAGLIGPVTVRCLE